MWWIPLAVMTAAAVLCIVWPLVRAARVAGDATSDVDFYRAQLAELDADLARGALPAEQAAEARVELGRRLLAAAGRAGTAAEPRGPKGRRMPLAAAVLVTLLVPVASIWLYSRVGEPGRSDEPLAAREMPDQTLQAAVRRIETHLLTHPDDGRGFEVLAPVYYREGRFDRAAEAYGKALTLLGSTAERQTRYGQALVMAAEGTVTARARQAFDAALALDPKLPEARFYLSLAAEQDGDRGRARDLLASLVADAQPDAPWLSVVKRHIEDLDRPPAVAMSGPAPAPEGGPHPPVAGAATPAGIPEGGAAIAALPADQQAGMIRSMVERLAGRLAQDGHDAEGWLRLVRAYSVLGEGDKARAALTDARRWLKDDPSALDRLQGLAHELGLES